MFWAIAAAHGPIRLAEDALQDAAREALGRLRDLKDDAAFRPWTAAFVRNAARNLARREQRRATEDAAALEDLPAAARPNTPPLGALDADALALDDRLAEALDALAPDARAALVLSAVHGLSYEEIALLLDVPAGTVGSHVSRARRVLRERLAPTEVRHDR